jgi:hypothetical protein
MRRIVIPTTAGLALIVGAGFAAAQGPEHGREGGPPGGVHGQGPGAGQMHIPGPSGGPTNIPRGGPPRVEGPAHPTERRAEPERRLDGQRATEREQRRGAEQNQNAERSRSAEHERALQQQKRGEEERQRKAAEQPSGRREASEPQRGQRVSERREEIQQARTRLGVEDRERLHRAFDLRRARVGNARFDWHVGHAVPRSVRLYPVPAEVISFFPYYRDFNYFVVDDNICIVDPRTYEVVDVIDDGYRAGPRPQVAGLGLSGSQVALVRDSIPRDFPETPIRLRLALGAEIPADVELYELPVIVQDRVPELREFRFLVAEEQIIIVDPHDRSIALVIDKT